ncbi:MAG TPA: hypothetical protein VFL86_10155, partial [Burkholderiaceae bacterium]|nr:hypothetical protein [Burkholderiaceae bacterium]
MHVIAQRIRTKRRERWFRSRPLFRQFKPVGLADIERVEGKIGVSLPDDLKVWLLSVGYGDVDDTLSFRHDWFHAIDQGHPL